MKLDGAGPAIDDCYRDHLPPTGLASHRICKRLMFLAIVIAFRPLWLPILVASALALLFSMGRPVLFVQPRSGLGGKVCRIYELPTMQ